MNQNSQIVAVATPEKFRNLPAAESNLSSWGLIQYNFQITGVGSGFFSYSDTHLTRNGLESAPIESLVWNGKEIQLSSFQEHSIYVEQGEFLGLNLLGEGWEILFHRGIKVNGLQRVGEVSYQQVATSSTAPLKVKTQK